MAARNASEALAGTPAPIPHPALSRRANEESLVDSYRRLAEVFHHVLSEQSLDTLLERIADTLSELIPYDRLTLLRADEAQGLLIPVLARDQWAEQIMSARFPFGKGLTGWAVEHRQAVLANQAHLDPRVEVIPGTPLEPESFISVPLVARGRVKGALNVYRNGEDALFTEEEFELARWFGDAAALALDNAEVRARLEHQAKTDSLTGLYNHRYFHERLRAELTRSGRSHDAIAVMMMDIDDFKRVNDIHGHAAGDHVLVTLADLLARTARGCDVVCRVGGEEFAVIMPSSDTEEALALARRLASRMTNLEFAPAGKVTLSIGIAHSPEHAMNSRELVACADAAMLAAKSRGKNGVAVFGDGEAQERTHSQRHAVRTIAHMKMLQSLSGKLSRLNEVREIGNVIVTELRTLIDYHNCRVYTIEGDEMVPIAFRGELADYEHETVAMLSGYKVGEGITGAAAACGKSLLVHDTNACEHAVQIPGTQPIDESMIATPLTFGSRVIGVIVISKLGVGQFDQDDVRLLEVLGGHAAVALENARLYEAERREAENAKALLEIANSLLEFSRDLATAEDLDTVAQRTVELAAKALQARQTSVWLEDPDGRGVAPLAFCGYDEAERRELAALRFPAEVHERFLTRREPFLLTNEELESIEDVRRRDAVYAVAPITVGAARLGCIAATLAPGDEAAFGERKIRLLAGIAHQAQLAMTNASNFTSLERTFLSTVESLANALEANDEHTSSHTRQIAETAVEVATALGLQRHALKRVELGALLHDIGKIGIPSKILCKPGPLTEEERSVVELHPQLGERIIAPIERLADVRPVVRHCHEHFDGRGYPDGLAGEEIPIESRIVFVCDAFHAMTTDRPYRRRLPHAEARRRLEQAAGTQFDPRVVETYLRLL
ncbi:MAG: diguanylate cyclase, partial [Actinomycetota bacterium]|nr:diguanylate cyclase [Actinomycetota bacterium]